MCGLPFIAKAGARYENSYLGILVMEQLRDAFSTDVLEAVVHYKWHTFARRAFLKCVMVARAGCTQCEADRLLAHHR